MTAATAATMFRAVSYRWRLYSGANALDALAGEVDRAGAGRAFVLCGQSVAHHTNLLDRIATALGPRYAGVFDGVDKNCTFEAMVAGAEAARKAGADLLIAAGGGAVMMAGRIIAIYLAEPGDPFELMTQYPEGKPAISPRLTAPKLPIINVLTTGTTAMNRGGAAAKNVALDHRMEYFDPKTRPVALFWDHEALMTAPVDLARSTGATTFSSALHGLASGTTNPLVEGDVRQAFRLALRALPRVVSEPDNPAPRVDLCASAFLQNRAADDGSAQGARHPLWSASYALASVLHVRYRHVGQGEGTSAVEPAVLRRMGAEEPALIGPVAEALGVWHAGMAATEAAEAAGDALERFYHSVGMPVRVRDLRIPEEDLPGLAADTPKIFNAYRGTRPAQYVADMLSLLRAAW